MLAAYLPYTQVPSVLAQLLMPIYIDIKSVEAIAQRIGRAVAAAPVEPQPLAQRALAARWTG